MSLGTGLARDESIRVPRDHQFFIRGNPQGINPGARRRENGLAPLVPGLVHAQPQLPEGPQDLGSDVRAVLADAGGEYDGVHAREGGDHLEDLEPDAAGAAVQNEDVHPHRI